jgi:hypothetical protein
LTVTAPPPPTVRFCLGVTGHRADHPAFAANRGRIEATLGSILDRIDAVIAATPPALGPGSNAPARLHGLLADGTDHAAARLALARGWELVAPLPFGRRLNEAVNGLPESAADARALLAGGDAADAGAQARVEAIRELSEKARIFELADQDAELSQLLLARLDAPSDFAKAQLFAARASERVALAGRILIEQSDILLAVWDGATTAHGGGTGHTVAAALDFGAPVVWIDPAEPETWRILNAPESLAALRLAVRPDSPEAALETLVRDVLRPDPAQDGRPGQGLGVGSLDAERWRPRSSRLWHAYRRTEALFGAEKGRSPFRSLVQTYETPDAISTGSGADLLQAVRDLPGGDPGLADQISAKVLGRYAWADGISSRLSDSYRSGMVVAFLLAAFAVVGGMAYLPFVPPEGKWPFALFEFLVLANILAITAFGQRRRWHDRWFETRRVAEYLRHGPLLLALGVARAPGRWPQGSRTSWPEWWSRHALREIGLPHATVTPAYLRAVLGALLDDHVLRQRDYHRGKAQRLTAVHHNLDRVSERLFQLAVVSVTAYLVLKGVGVLARLDESTADRIAELFTLAGVMLPTFAGAIAGIRFFGDFERFAAISEVTAEKLDALHGRITLLLSAPDDALSYGRAAEIAHGADEVVVAEIENWQAVFGGKHISVPT